MKMDLQKFAGSLTVTVVKDANANWTAASASPASSLAEGDKVTLTVTPATGYELDELIVTAGGVEIGWDEENENYYFYMGASNVTIFFRSKATTTYKVVENTIVSVNGSNTNLTRDMTIEYGVNGAIVDVKSDGTSLSALSADIVSALLTSGAIAPIEPRQKKVEVPAPDDT